VDTTSLVVTAVLLFVPHFVRRPEPDAGYIVTRDTSEEDCCASDTLTCMLVQTTPTRRFSNVRVVLLAILPIYKLMHSVTILYMIDQQRRTTQPRTRTRSTTWFILEPMNAADSLSTPPMAGRRPIIYSLMLK
jgi:hypothetical protein